MNKYKSKLAEYGKSINVKTGRHPSTEFLNACRQHLEHCKDTECHVRKLHELWFEKVRGSP